LTQAEKDKVFRNIIRARSQLVLDDPFFGSLSLKLEVLEDPAWLPYPTFATDGRVLAYDSGYASTLSFDELVGIICHEVMHNAEGHPWRMEGMEPEAANIAGDHAIDPLIIDAKKVLPAGAHLYPPWYGKSLEWIYAEIMKNGMPKDCQGCGAGDKPRGIFVRPQHDDAGSDLADWQVAVVQAAAMARAQGKLPASMEQVVKEITHPRVDWKAALRKFFTRLSKDDWTWRRPSRRYLANKMYMPSLYSENMPGVAILWDTSGSRDDERSRAECAAEISAICEEVRPERVHVLYVDDGVRRMETFEAGDPIVFNPMGGGGTSFEEVWPYIEEHELDICCLIGITDMMVSDWGEEPASYPVIWCATNNKPAPWGEVIRIYETEN